MTCIVIHEGMIVTDSRIGRHGRIVPDAANLDKLRVVDNPTMIHSNRLGVEDRWLGATYTGRGHVCDYAIGLVIGEMPLDNTIDFYSRIREASMFNPVDSFTIAFICERSTFYMECDSIEEKLCYKPHGSYMQHEPVPEMVVLGSAAPHLSEVMLTYALFKNKVLISDVRSGDGAERLNPLAVALAVSAQDETSGGVFSLWRVVPDGDDKFALKYFGQREARPNDLLYSKDLTEYIPLDLWNEGGQIPYDPITYPPTKTLKKEETDVERKEVPEVAEANPGRKRRGSSRRVPGNQGRKAD